MNHINRKSLPSRGMAARRWNVLACATAIALSCSSRSAELPPPADISINEPVTGELTNERPSYLYKLVLDQPVTANLVMKSRFLNTITVYRGEVDRRKIVVTTCRSSRWKRCPDSYRNTPLQTDLEAGTYLLHVGGRSRIDDMSFTFTVGVDRPTSITLGGTAEGELDSVHPQRVYALVLDRQVEVEFRARGDRLPHLEVYRGKRVGREQRGIAVGRNLGDGAVTARMTLSPGLYSIKVQAIDEGSSRYTLSVTEAGAIPDAGPDAAPAPLRSEVFDG